MAGALRKTMVYLGLAEDQGRRVRVTPGREAPFDGFVPYGIQQIRRCAVHGLPSPKGTTLN